MRCKKNEHQTAHYKQAAYVSKIFFHPEFSFDDSVFRPRLQKISHRPTQTDKDMMNPARRGTNYF